MLILLLYLISRHISLENTNLAQVIHFTNWEDKGAGREATLLSSDQIQVTLSLSCVCH